MNLSATILPELVSSAPEILRGLWSTMGLATAITLIGVVGGILVFYLTLSPVPLVRRLVQGYISLLIGTPLLIILFLIYYGLPPLGIRLSPLVVALIGFGFNVSAYNARFLTTAYNALDPSEREAAAAQGFPPAQVFRLITLPQTLKLSMPALTNQAIQNVKDTSIVFLIQFTEFFSQMQEVANRTFRFLDSYVATGIAYLLLISIVSIIARMIERRLSVPGLEP